LFVDPPEGDRDVLDDRHRDPHLATLEELTRLLLEEASLEQLLAQLLDLTSRALSTCTAVSVTVVEDDGTYVTAAHTDEAAAAVDALQYELREGPCVDALQRAEERHCADLVADDRWPAVGGRANALGLRSVLALPLLLDGRCIGALNVFSGEVDGISSADQDLARRIAAPAATTLANARAYRRVSQLAEQLQEALESRAVIERAKGVVMAREGCDEDAAFGLLRRASQDHNRKVRDVAQAVVDAVADRAPAGRDG
jgi:GAF domain-containing protein